MTYRERFSKLNPDAGAKCTPLSKPVGDKIIYLSSDGDERNSGLTPDAPRCDIKRVAEYLKDGFSVLLKADSKWYIPDLGWELYDIVATEEAPLLVSTYGEGEPPVVAALHLLDPASWVEDGNGVMSIRSPGDTIRLYINGKMLIEVETDSELDTETFIQRDDRIYIKADSAPALAELTANNDGYEKHEVIKFRNVSYLTMQNFVIKGGQWTTVYGIAPSDHFTFDHMEFRSMLKYASSITTEEDNIKAYHNAYTVTNCIWDKTWSPRARYCYREDVYTKLRTSDGIFMTNGHVNGYIAGNIVRDFAHSAIDLQILDNRVHGIYGCIIERNVVSGTNSEYLRGCETIGPDGLCTDNTVRYNYFYDLTNSSHVLGEYNKHYCNVYAFIEPTRVSKTVQPYSMDSMSWLYNGFEFVARGNIIANNTIYNCAGSLAFASNDYNCTIVNNLLVGWNYDGAVKLEDTKEELSFLNNCFYSESNDNITWRSSGEKMKLDELNTMPESSGNIFAKPEFTDADGGDFTVKEGSACASAGKPISEFMDEPYLDMNGNPFDPEHPSVGAFSAI